MAGAWQELYFLCAHVCFKLILLGRRMTYDARGCGVVSFFVTLHFVHILEVRSRKHGKRSV